MPTTTNFGWTTPADTDLVKDGAAAIRTALGGVDTSFVDLKGGTTGQVLTKASNTDLDFSFVTPSTSPLTTKGDLFTFSTTAARLPVGTNGQVLTADSAEATGLKFATPSAGGQTQIATGSLSGATVTISSIPQTYKDLRLYVYNWSSTSGDGNMFLKINSTTADTFARMLGSTPEDDSTGTGGGGLRFSGGIVSSSVATNMGVIEFIDYTRTNAFKAFNAVYGSTNGATFQSFEGGGVYKNNSAITSILLDPESTQTFDNGTYVLVGIN